MAIQQPVARPKGPWCIYTPLNYERWAFYLEKHGLTSRFAHVLDGIKNGFSYRSSMSIAKTIVHKHHPSALAHPKAIDAYVKKEVDAKRYVGPFTQSELEALIGPFIAHPLGLVPKGSGGFRLVEDLSYPRDGDSVNSLTDLDGQQVNYGGFAAAANMIITAPPGSQGATVDIKDAFRLIPVKLEDLWMGIIHWPRDFFHVDFFNKFGDGASAHNFDGSAEGLSLIAIAEALGFNIYWVDDFWLGRSPINSFPPFQFSWGVSDFVKLAAELGIECPPSKIVDFGPVSRYIGFDWYWDLKVVRIPEEKRQKVLEIIQLTDSNPKISLSSLRTICGKLSHFSMAVPEGRAFLRGLWSMQTKMDLECKGKSWQLWPSAAADLAWWRSLLSSAHVGMRLCTQRIPNDSFALYCDASSSFGIGIVIGDEFDRFQLAPNWQTADGILRDIGFAEFIAVELLVFYFFTLHDIRDCHILIHTDNMGVIGAWEQRSSRNPEQNQVLIRIMRRLLDRQCFLTLKYIKSSENPADAPSRGLDAPGRSRRTFKGFPSHLAGLMYRK
jgi:hypothetical protein